MRVLPRSASVLPLLLAALAGCGGGGGSSSGGAPVPANGSARVSIAWPARSAGRFIPLSSNSVVVTLTLKGAQKASQVVARTSDDAGIGIATFTGLPYGQYVVGIEARPGADGSGNAQAKGTASMAVTEDAPGIASVSLATTVASLSILPVTFAKNGTATVDVGAKDAGGATVLLAVGDASEAVSWAADPIQNSLGAMVDAVTLSASTGSSVVLTGVHSGTTQIHASIGLGLATPLTATGSVTVSAIDDGTGTVTVS